MSRKSIVLTLTLVILCGSISAQMVTDRPDQTESSSTIAKGALQVESGMLLSFEEIEMVSFRQILLPTTLFRYGIASGIELRLLNQFELLKVADESYQGISDLEIGTKIQLLSDDTRNTEIALLAQVSLPTGSRDLSGGTRGPSGFSVKLSVSHSLGENAGIGYNLGYDHPEGGYGNLTYSLVYGFGINDKVSAYVEPYGEITDMNKFVSNINAGFTFLARDNLQFDFSFGTGINHRMNFLSLGCSWLIEKE
jgi:hypothetical protein